MPAGFRQLTLDRDRSLEYLLGLDAFLKELRSTGLWLSLWGLRKARGSPEEGLWGGTATASEEAGVARDAQSPRFTKARQNLTLYLGAGFRLGACPV